MCGICGIVSHRSSESLDEKILKKMMEIIHHRGPDGEGLHKEQGVLLGHVRLSIIDIAGGQQPIYNEDRTKCIIYNGELYNYLNLRKNLIQKGHRFTTNSDTETILHLYEEDGYACLEKLRGMFAFAIWDSIDQKLFIARDRLGIKPLYYSNSSDKFCFSSEIKALLFANKNDHVFNPASIDQYLALNYTIGPQTAFNNIKKLMPGNYLIYNSKKVNTVQYWNFNNIQKTTASYNDCFKKLSEIIEDSIRIRLMSEVPLGAFLSGGVDSSVTVGIMTRLTNNPVKTFTVGYENAFEESELEYAKKVAQYFQTEHHEFVLKPRKFFDIVSKVIWHLDEPIAEIATIPLLLLSELAKDYVTVMLSGEGADEIFAGYPIYRYMMYIQKYQNMPHMLRHHVFDHLARILLRNRREGKYLKWILNPLEERYLGNGSYFTEEMRKKLYTKEFANLINTQDVGKIILSYYNQVKRYDSIRKMLYLDTKTWLPEDLLIKADKMTMASGLELRVPFLDHVLVEYATSLPSQFKATLKHSKYIFKKYAETIVPKEIVYRKKKGFPVPIKQWLKGDLYKIACDILLDSRTKNRGIFNLSYVENLIVKHKKQNIDYSKNIWNLLILEMWLRIFIDGDSF